MTTLALSAAATPSQTDLPLASLDLLEEADHLRSILRSCHSRRSVAKDRALRRIESELHALGTARRSKSPFIAIERRLARLAWDIRTLLLSEVYACTARIQRSPPHARGHALPTSGRVEHTYERNLQPTALESRLARFAPAPPPGYRAHHLIFSSGMASISAFYQSFLRITKATAERPLAITNAGAYFETRVLFDLLSSSVVRTTNLSDEDAIVQTPADILHVETTRYDWDLEPLAISTLTRAAARCRRLAIVVDTTLSGARFPVDTLLRRLAPLPNAPALVVQLASGLKLHQEGLELANVGLMTIYERVSTAASSRGDFVPRFVDFLRKMRTILGVCPSLETVASLEKASFFLDPTRRTETSHADRVFAANAKLARSVPTGGLFERIAHPARSRRADTAAVAPFVVFHLREDDLDNHGLLLGVLAFEARRRRLDFSAGSSFGFRGHRYECIVPNLHERRALFKVALGSRPGPFQHEVIRLIDELARYPSFARLRAAYPEIVPVDMQAVVRSGATRDDTLH